MKGNILTMTDTPHHYTPIYTEEYTRSVLVTGGVGFVGSHVTESLLRSGSKVVVYDSFNTETTERAEKVGIARELHRVALEHAHLGASLVVVKGDIRDRALIMKTIARYSIASCVHLGAMVDDRRSVSLPDEFIDVNIRGTATLLDALGASGVKMVVQASTRSVFGQREHNGACLTESADRRPVNPYGASKVGSDAIAHCYSRELMIYTCCAIFFSLICAVSKENARIFLTFPPSLPPPECRPAQDERDHRTHRHDLRPPWPPRHDPAHTHREHLQRQSHTQVRGRHRHADLGLHLRHRLGVPVRTAQSVRRLCGVQHRCTQFHHAQ